MPRQREWTERDVSLLHELYNLREMTKEQIMRRYFEGNAKYGSKRLYILRDEGLVVSEVHGTRKGEMAIRTAYYRLTEKGLRLLREKGRIGDHKERARDLKWSLKQREYMTDANELHLGIPEVPFLDSRAIKKRHGLNRGDRTVGGFTAEDGDYLIYVLNANAKEETLIKIIEEIRKPKSIRGVMVYAKSESVKHVFKSFCEKQGLVTGGVPLYVLPFDHFGIRLAREYIFSNTFLKLEKLFEPYGKLVLVPAPSKYGFLYGVHQESGKRGPYVIELLTGDIMIMKRCLRSYNRDASQREGRRVLLFCYEDEVERYKQELSSAAHVDIVGISQEIIERSFERSDS
ncbi:replication-relaxation family protein [Paenibacillus sp. HN-1]|uniref:replication-relaxation family protein n=1 Tax=Paenibacillus TaxID=44249 RepID=UPI001CA9AA3A|nr:replication-relaxation family protein [Paenibacillus sp. CGMCC 1.18879]MBY9079560.1 replication-relaxation family protein [Paenibacillus sp. CGMCC 1.18879]MBY9083381.1 replication-relaxation family protein [Paenibacillus sinensis]